MIFLSQMFPACLAMRSAFRKLPRHRAPSRGAICWLNYVGLIFLLLAFDILPLQGQKDVALRASDLMRAGKFRDAELLWRQLARQHPRDAVIHGNLGVTLAQQGKLEPATVEYRKSLALKP